MSRNKDIVLVQIEKHVQKAQVSEYDRSVAILAVLTARKVAAAVPPTENETDYAASVLSALNDLKAGYHDADGVYTSGKGVLGALIDDVYLALSKVSN